MPLKKLFKNYGKRLKERIKKNKEVFLFNHKGYCPCCDKKVYFKANHHWLRDHFKCSNCGSIPRERALMTVIEKEFSNWKDLEIHESSPGNRGHSKKLKTNKRYLETQFFEGEPLGKIIKGVRNEDLENQSFANEVFDIVVTADVMEHIYHPEKAFKEIHRTLKPGGAHIFSVPLVNKHTKSQRWAVKGEDGTPQFLFFPEWHGNPINQKGSPVTMHWGFDIIDKIKEYTGAESEILYLDNLDYGIRGEYIEIIVSRKEK